MSAPSGGEVMKISGVWDRVVAFLSAIVVVTYLLQALGGRLTTVTAVAAVVVALAGVGWVLRGDRAGPSGWKAFAVGISVLLVAGASHLLLPSTTPESSVLISDVTVIPVGQNLVVQGSIAHLGSAHAVPITVSAGSVTTSEILPSSAETFAITVNPRLQDPCSTFVFVQASHRSALGPYACQQEGP